MRHLLGVFCFSLASFAGHGADTLWVELGAKDVGKGLTVLNYPDGDGETKPLKLGGRTCRRTDLEGGSTHFYVNVDDAFVPPKNLYVTVEYFDQSGMLAIHFDAGEGMSAYRPVPEAHAQTGTKQWLAKTFNLRRAQFKNRENGGADFRIHADGPLAISRITLSPTPPEGFKSSLDPVDFFRDRPPVQIAEGMTVIQQWQVHEPVPEGQLADSAYLAAKKTGITSLQSYVG
jgi:hypothetical protein